MNRNLTREIKRLIREIAKGERFSKSSTKSFLIRLIQIQYVRPDLEFLTNIFELFKKEWEGGCLEQNQDTLKASERFLIEQAGRFIQAFEHFLEGNIGEAVRLTYVREGFKQSGHLNRAIVEVEDYYGRLNLSRLI